jgi:uncharacterized membrane protein
LGWIIESTWVSLHQKRLVNRGFLRGPFIPIYGCGAMTLVLVGTPLLKWPVAVFFGGMISASILEYFTGAAMEAIFKVRYWDYSDKPFNLNGHICLFTSVCWGGLSLAVDYVIHKPIVALTEHMTYKELVLMVTVVTVYFIVDCTLSFKAAFDLRAIIIKMEKAKEELRLMQKRLDVILAFADADKDAFIDASLEKAGDIIDGIEERFAAVKKAMEETPAKFAENIKNELSELRDKFVIEKRDELSENNIWDFYKRGIFLGNPTLKSVKFSDTVDTLKDYVMNLKNKSGKKK